MSVDYLNMILSYYDFVPLTSGTTGRRKLTKAALLEAPISIAGAAEQAEIVRIVTNLMSLADRAEQRLLTTVARTDKLPQAILSKAFSGELVPTEADLAIAEGRQYEPASELLKRIKSEADLPVVTKDRRSTKKRSTRG
jgi:type I restriction enzyme, S subunit